MTHTEAVPRILVADDRDEHRGWVVHHLRAQGFVVHEATSGIEVMQMLFAVMPGYFTAVVCDQLMPGLRGTECLARGGSRAPFVIVTASRDALIETAAEQFGAAAILRKPFDAATLTDVIRAIAADAHLRRVARGDRRRASDSPARRSGARLKHAFASSSVLIVERDRASATDWEHAIGAIGAPVLVTADANEARIVGACSVAVLGTFGSDGSPIDLARELATRPTRMRPRVVLVHSAPIRRVDRAHLDAALEHPVRTDVLVDQVRRLLTMSARRALGSAG